MFTEKQENELLKKLTRFEKPGEQSESLEQLSNIVYRRIPELLERKATCRMWEAYDEFKYMYHRFLTFLLFKSLKGKKIVSVGGRYGSGKSSFLNSIFGNETENLPSTVLPAYIVGSRKKVCLAINKWNSWCELSEDELKAVTDGIGVGTGREPVSHLLEWLLLATTRQPYDKLAFLDTPGFSREGDDDYSEAFDEKVVFSHLSNSDFIFWLVSAEREGLSEEEIAFLKRLDDNIPKVIVLSRIEGLKTGQIKKLVVRLRAQLAGNGILFEDICTFSNKEKVVCDITKIREIVARINTGATATSFERAFSGFFEICQDYYDTKAELAKERFRRLSQCILLTQNREDAMACVDEILMVFRDKITLSVEAKKQCENISKDYFAELALLTGIGSLDKTSKEEEAGSNYLDIIDFQHLWQIALETVGKMPETQADLKKLLAMQTDNLGYSEKALVKTTLGYKLIFETLLMASEEDNQEKVAGYIDRLAAAFLIDYRSLDEMKDMVQQMQTVAGNNVFSPQTLPLPIAEELLLRHCRQVTIYTSDRVAFLSDEMIQAKENGVKRITNKEEIHIANVEFVRGNTFSLANCGTVVFENCLFRDITINRALFEFQRVDRVTFENCRFENLAKSPVSAGGWLVVLEKVDWFEMNHCSVADSDFGNRHNLIFNDARCAVVRVKNCATDGEYTLG